MSTKLLEKKVELSAFDMIDTITRHQYRPQTQDYIPLIFKEERELHGDRKFGDDQSIYTGLVSLKYSHSLSIQYRKSLKCMLIGHRKGHETLERINYNWGYAHAEGYRKALHKMKIAEKFGLPVITFTDTPGAMADMEAEERGIAEAIATNLKEMSRLRTPIINVIIGEGSSGGALGIGVADKIAMLENAYYSVITPEGCAAILWKDYNDLNNDEKVRLAAEAMKLTAEHNLNNGIIDEIIPEPNGGAHTNPLVAARNIQDFLYKSIYNLQRDVEVEGINKLLEKRYQKFRRIGFYG